MYSEKALLEKNICVYLKLNCDVVITLINDVISQKSVSSTALKPVIQK